MLSNLLKNYIPVEIKRIRAINFLETQRSLESIKIKNVKKGHGWKNVHNCPLCGSKKHKNEFSKYNIPLKACLNCELRFHAKIPANPNDVYQNLNYRLFSKKDSKRHFNYRKKRFGIERVKLLEKFCGNLTNKKILDVGCGDGYFLAAAKEKCKNCIGSEFSKKLKEAAKKNTGLMIYGESLEEFPERNFDIITIFDVIEHIKEPAEFLKSVKNLLKPGGYILIYTPNFDSFSIKVMKEYSSIIDPTEHVVLFNNNSSKKLAAILGLKVLYVETQGLDINSIIAYQSYKKEKPSKFLLEWLNELQAMINASGAADYMRIIYKKN